MGVNVDEAGRDDLPSGVDDLLRRPVVPAHRCDAVPDDHDVGLERRRPAAVDDRSPSNDEIGFHHRPSDVNRTEAGKNLKESAMPSVVGDLGTYVPVPGRSR